jgi:hypothetical protein
MPSKQAVDKQVIAEKWRIALYDIKGIYDEQWRFRILTEMSAQGVVKDDAQTMPVAGVDGADAVLHVDAVEAFAASDRTEIGGEDQHA